MLRWRIVTFPTKKKIPILTVGRIRIKPIICIAKSVGIRPNLAIFPLRVHGRWPNTVFFWRCFAVTRWENWEWFSNFFLKFSFFRLKHRPIHIMRGYFCGCFLALFRPRWDRVAAVPMIYESRVVVCRELHQLSVCERRGQKEGNKIKRHQQKARRKEKELKLKQKCIYSVV